jgi:polyisoprenoid-binding protein YceI
MKIVYSFLLASLLYLPVHAQTYLTRNGKINFFSKTPLEDIKAENKQVYAAMDLSKKTIAFTLLQKGFLFEKQLMQDHYNENYVESEKYPKASFVGNIKGDVSSTPGTYKVQIEGKLTIHNTTQSVTFPATLEVTADKVVGTSSFALKPQDYNIQIPSLVKDKIAKEISVQVNVECLQQK